MKHNYQIYQTFDLNNFPNTVWEKHENTNTSKQPKKEPIRPSVIQHTKNIGVMNTLHKKINRRRSQENNIKIPSKLNTDTKDCCTKQIEYTHKKFQYKMKEQ